MFKSNIQMNLSKLTQNQRKFLVQIRMYLYEKSMITTCTELAAAAL